MQADQYLFICGMSRGGTTWLGHCLNEHPNVAVYGESLYWGHNYIEPLEGGYSKGQVEQSLNLLASGTRAFLGESPGDLKHIDLSVWESLRELNVKTPCSPAFLYSQVCEWLAVQEKVDFVIEKTPHHIDWIPRIKQALPEAKFVMMVRDPYGFMLSYKHQGDRKSPRVKKQFDQLYHPLGCAFVWRRYMQSALRAERDYSSSVLRIEFQSLRTEPQRVWDGVLSFFGLPLAPLSFVDEQNSSFPEERPKLESVDIFWMNCLSGRAIRNAGYEVASSDVGVFDLVRSFFSLFPWCFFIVQHLGRNVPGGILKYLKLKK